MQMASRSLQILAAVLAFGVAGAAEPVCPAGSGLCKELQQEQPTGVEMLQFAAESVPGARGARSQLSAVQEQAGKRQLPDALKNLVPKSVTDAVGQVAESAALGLGNILNWTLGKIDDQADVLMAHCTQYKEDLLGNVSAAADKGIDTAMQTLQKMLIENFHIQEQWNTLMDVLKAGEPPVISSLKALGLDTVAIVEQEVFDNIVFVGSNVSAALGNLTGSLGKVANATKEERDQGLERITSWAEQGMTALASLKVKLVEMVDRLVTTVCDKLGIQLLQAAQAPSKDSSTMTEVLRALKEGAAAIAEKIESAMDMIFSGTIEAATIAVKGPEKKKGAAYGSGMQMGVALVAACVSLGQL